MFDPIPAHELCKYFVCKVASPVTDDSPGCSESTQNVPLQETHSTASSMYKFPNDGGKGPIKSIPHT